LDKTKLFPLRYLRALRYIPNNAPCHGTGYLAEQHFFTGRCLDGNTGSLVERGRLGMPCHEVFPRMVAEETHFATYRITVNVYIDRRHKDGNLQPPIMKVLRFFGFLDHDHFAIRRAKDDVLVCDNMPSGVPEKLQNGN